MTLAALPGWLKPSGHDTLLIDGKAVAATLVGSVRDEAATLPAGLKPGLAVVLVGDDPASAVYVRSKSWMAADCGFHSIQHTLPATTGEAELLALVGRLNADPTIHGILVQLPLPPTIDPVRVVESIAPEKDVDGLHPINAGLLAIGDRRRALVPCTPAGCSVLIERTAAALDYKVAGRRAVVIGRSNLVGKPIAQLLLADNCTVTIAHRYTRDLRDLVGEAEILIVAIGQPEAIDGGWIRPGALVIDVGVNRVPHLTTPGKTRLVGDVALDKALGRAAAITPVPGGVGPMTIAMLMANTLTACKRAAG